MEISSTLPELWQQKTSIQQILDKHNVKYIQGSEIKLISLINQDTLVLSNTGIFDRKLQQEINTAILLTKNDREYYTIIGGFENSDPKRFINAGKKLGLCALQLFKRFGIENIFFGALPPPNKPSPLTYYMRGKFQPLNTTEDEILKLTDNYRKHADSNTNYAIMMPQNADILKLAEKYNFLKSFV